MSFMIATDIGAGCVGVVGPVIGAIYGAVANYITVSKKGYKAERPQSSNRIDPHLEWAATLDRR